MTEELVVHDGRVSTRSDLDLSILEEILEADHCESSHSSPDWPKECSHTPVAIFEAKCGMKRKVCLNIARDFDNHASFLCVGCYRRCSDCWSLMPL